MSEGFHLGNIVWLPVARAPIQRKQGTSWQKYKKKFKQKSIFSIKTGYPGENFI